MRAEKKFPDFMCEEIGVCQPWRGEDDFQQQVLDATLTFLLPASLNQFAMLIFQEALRTMEAVYY